MEHLLEGRGVGELTQKSKIVYVTLLIWVNVPMS